MALRAGYESGAWQQHKGGHQPMALDVGGAGSPLRRMLGLTGYSPHVVDPKVNVDLETAVRQRISAPFVTCISTIEHVRELQGFIVDLRSVVDPGGVLFLTSDIWNQRDEEPDKAHWHWMRERIFTPRTWEATAAEFCADGEMALFGDHDFSWQDYVIENWGYGLCSMALRRRV